MMIAVRILACLLVALTLGCFVAMGTDWLTEPAYWFGRVGMLLVALLIFIFPSIWEEA